jgi:GNAT superfamily N-acetyltransferase
MISVRPATVADIPAMSDVLVASITALCVEDHENRPEAVAPWLWNKTPEGVARMLANPAGRMFVAERDGVIAAVGAVNDGREVTLNYVSPEHRFTGVSKAMLAALEAALGPGEATLTSTVTAHRFYRGQGWTDHGQSPRSAGMTSFEMRKLL